MTTTQQVDAVEIVRDLLHETSVVTEVTEGRVFSYELPRSENEHMPRSAVCVRWDPGAPAKRDYTRAGFAQLEVWAWGETPAEAAKVGLACYEVLQQTGRVVRHNALLNHANRLARRDGRDPLTDWPTCLQVFEAHVSEVAIA